MQYSEAIQFLYQLQLSGTRLGLENAFRLAALAGNPHAKLRFIHVAGTNGKGSTCAMLESIYRAAGLRVGLFTSPHLIAFSERIQVNRVHISEAEVVRQVEAIKELLREFPADSMPTFFEVVTVMGLRHFLEQECDLVIWETGLGGRLDSTNIVTPLASVITNIQQDHEKWLGETLAQIAFEKAGIIKPGVPTVTAEEEPEPLQVLVETARQRGSPLTLVSREDVTLPPLNQLQLPLLGAHQNLNAALAVATVRVLHDLIPVNDAAIRSGLTQTHWAGRLQVIRPGVGRAVVLDGAHNPAGAEALKVALQHYFPGTLATIIFGVMGDKDWMSMCNVLMPLAGRICLAPVTSQRTADPKVLLEHCLQLNPYAEASAFSSLAEAIDHTHNDPLVVVTGSLHFIGEAMEILKISAALPRNERGLNDWGAATTTK